MKKLKLLSILFALSVFYSCQKEKLISNDQNAKATENNNTFANSIIKFSNENMSSNLRIGNISTTKEIKYKNIIGNIPSGYPSELFDFKTIDIENIALKKSIYNKNIKDGMKGNSLSEIISKILKQYPSFDDFKSQEYKKYFPKLSNAEIDKNSEEIKEFIEKIIAYEIAASFSLYNNLEYKLGNITNKNARGYISSFDWLNTACTVSVVIAHPRLDISGLRTAVDEANSKCFVPGIPSPGGGGNDQVDAIRHGIWGVYLGKFGTWRYSDQSNARSIIAQLLNAHECGQSGLGTNMDFHNNQIALNYYSANVTQTGSWPNRNTRVHKTTETIVNEIANYQRIYCQTVQAINAVGSDKLVYITQ